MSEPTRNDPGWINNTIVTENFNKFPAEELLKYSGMFVAFNEDGSRILLSAPTELELVEQVEKSGLDPSRVIITYMD